MLLHLVYSFIKIAALVPSRQNRNFLKYLFVMLETGERKTYQTYLILGGKNSGILKITS